MTRALNIEEILSLQVGDPVARFVSLGRMEVGNVSRFTATQIIVSWPCESCRYYKETGARTDCHGDVLRVMPAPPATPEIDHVTTDLGNGAANIEPNDEAQIVAAVRADRMRAKEMSAGKWMNELERYLRERLGWEHATPAEHEALQLACETPGTYPECVLERDFARREAPYYTAASLSAWVVRQRSVAQVPAVPEPDYLQF